MTVLSVEELQQIVVDAFPDFDMPIIEFTRGRTRLSSPSPRRRVTRRPGGTLSGPTMMALADNAAWLVILAQIGPVLLAVTTSLHIDFLRKPDVTDLLARARLIKLGSRLAVVDVDLYSRGSNELVAKASRDVLDSG